MFPSFGERVVPNVSQLFSWGRLKSSLRGTEHKDDMNSLLLPVILNEF